MSNEDKPLYWSVTYNGQHTANVFPSEALAQGCIDRLNAIHPDDARSIVPLYAAQVPAAGVQGEREFVVQDADLQAFLDAAVGWVKGEPQNMDSGLYMADLLERIEARLKQPDSGRAAALEEALNKALSQMDLARNLLTDGKPTPNCNWGMLDTSTIRAALTTRPAPSSDAAIARRTMFAAYSECLTSTDMTPVEIADKLLAAAHPANGAQATPEFELALDRAIDQLGQVDESDTMQVREARQKFFDLFAATKKGQ